MATSRVVEDHPLGLLDLTVGRAGTVLEPRCLVAAELDASFHHAEKAANTIDLFAVRFAEMLVPRSHDSGIMKWPTSAVCFGPPLGPSELLVLTERELRTGAGVGLENQGGALRADSPGV